MVQSAPYTSRLSQKTEPTEIGRDGVEHRIADRRRCASVAEAE